MEKITENMKIEEILQKHPETAEVFVKHGFHCLGCAAANFETIKDGADVHGITTKELIEDLNKAIEKK